MVSEVGAFVISVLVGFVILYMAARHMVVCRPNEILVLSGRRYVLPDGRSSGYRVVFGGRVFKVPILERLDRLSTHLIPLNIELTDAYSKGGSRLLIDAIANIKVSSDSRFVLNAVERFLGKEQREIAQVATETLEGILRNAVVFHTPQSIHEDRLDLSQTVQREMVESLERLGLQLDTFRIKRVSAS